MMSWKGGERAASNALGLCPRPRTRREAATGDEQAIPGNCQERGVPAKASRGFRGINAAIKPPHLFHGPLDPFLHTKTNPPPLHRPSPRAMTSCYPVISGVQLTLELECSTNGGTPPLNHGAARGRGCIKSLPMKVRIVPDTMQLLKRVQ